VFFWYDDGETPENLLRGWFGKIRTTIKKTKSPRLLSDTHTQNNTRKDLKMKKGVGTHLEGIRIKKTGRDVEKVKKKKGGKGEGKIAPTMPH